MKARFALLVLVFLGVACVSPKRPRRAQGPAKTDRGRKEARRDDPVVTPRRADDDVAGPSEPAAEEYVVEEPASLRLDPPKEEAVVAKRRPTCVVDERGVVIGAEIDESVVRKTIHVAAEVGPDAVQDGSAARPFGSLAPAMQAAVQSLEAGVATRVLVGAGTYREPFGTLDFSRGKANSTLLVIEGSAPGEVTVSGADIFPGEEWEDVGGGVYSHDWPYDFGNKNVPWNTMTNVLGQRVEMAWVNGEPLRPMVLEEYDLGGFWTADVPEHERGKLTVRYVRFHDPRSTLKPGTFGVAERDENGNRIFIRPPAGTDVAASEIELSVRGTLLKLNSKEKLVLRNLRFEKAASRLGWDDPIIDNCVTARPWESERLADVLVEGCVFEWNSGEGYRPHAIDGLTVRECRFNHNGLGGACIGEVERVLWEDNETNFNGWRDYMAGALFRNHNWGGAKWGASSDVLVRRHVAVGNLYDNFWFDIHCKNIVVEDSAFAFGARRGLFFELSQGPFVARRCLMANNSWIGYENMVVGEALVERNIVYASTGAGVSFHHHVRGNEHADRAAIRPGESIEMRGNVVVGGPNTWPGTGLVQFTNALKERGEVFDRPFKGYRGDGNWYFHADPRRFKYVVELDKVDEMLDLAGWERKWGERESGARWVDPRFVDPERCDFRLLPGSPLAGREDEYLIWRLEPAKIEEMKRYFTWATTDCQVEPYETIPTLVARAMDL